MGTKLPQKLTLDQQIGPKLKVKYSQVQCNSYQVLTIPMPIFKMFGFQMGSEFEIECSVYKPQLY